MQQPPDEFEFCADGPDAGTLLVVTDGWAFRARRPVLREYKHYRRSVADLFGEDDVAEWVTSVVSVLSGYPVDPVPSWFCDPTLPSRIIDHWRHVPLGPWEPVDKDPAPSVPILRKKPLKGWFAELAPIYESLAIRNVTARDADEMEIWEIASVLGLHDPDRDTASKNTGSGSTAAARRGPPPNPRAPDATSILRARVEAAQTGAPAPKWQREHASGGESELIAGLQKRTR